MQLNLRPRYEADEWAPMWSRVLERASALPGATAATIATEAPFAGNRLVSTYRPEDTEAGDPAGVFLNTVAVMGDYVGALGGQVVEGRALAPRDDDGPPVALVNEAFVRRFWPGESAVGKHVRSGGAGVDDEPDFEVVGVIADMITDPGRPVPERIYVPSRYEPQSEMEVMVRTEEDPVATAAALRNVARTLDPTLPAAVRTVTSLGWEALARPRFYAGLFGGFAVVALLLTLVGVYGTTAYNTRARTREIGIRLALGADVTQVVGRVVSRAGTAVVGGTVVGLLAAALGGRIMEGFLHDVGPGDLPSYAVVGILVLAGGLVAAWLPARRAGRVDPVETLRREG